MVAVAKSALGAMPCPFCGGTDLHLETDSHPSTVQVMCDNPECEASGPNVAYTDEDAVALWNRRPAVTGA